MNFKIPIYKGDKLKIFTEANNVICVDLHFYMNSATGCFMKYRMWFVNYLRKWKVHSVTCVNESTEETAALPTGVCWARLSSNSTEIPIWATDGVRTMFMVPNGCWLPPSTERNFCVPHVSNLTCINSFLKMWRTTDLYALRSSVTWKFVFSQINVKRCLCVCGCVC